ncbi:hypothetical protein [Luteitalea sp.]
MGRGGSRVGTGPKPSAKRTTLAPVAPVIAPADLTDAERAQWDRLAPTAVAMGTLVPETVPGFRLLVEVAAERVATAGIIAGHGRIGSGGAHPLLTHLRQLTQRLESLLARYRIAAMGRPAEVPTKSEPDAGTAGKRDFYGTLRAVR